MYFFIVRKQKRNLEDVINDLNTLEIFNDKDKRILNPIYNSELEILKNIILPFGIMKKGKIIF